LIGTTSSRQCAGNFLKSLMHCLFLVLQLFGVGDMLPFATSTGTEWLQEGLFTHGEALIISVTFTFPKIFLLLENQGIDLIARDGPSTKSTLPSKRPMPMPSLDIASISKSCTGRGSFSLSTHSPNLRHFEQSL
jgi:hypothetical protein